MLIVTILCIIKKFKNDKISENENENDEEKDSKNTNDNNEMNKKDVINIGNDNNKGRFNHIPIEKSSEDIWKNYKN